MRIGLDARLYNESGVGRYIRNLLFYLQKLETEDEYYIFLLAKEYDRLVYHTRNFHKVRADFKWYSLTEQIKFPILIKKYNLDLIHFPHFNVPIFYAGKFIVTIHDLIHQHFKMNRATTLNPLIYRIKHVGYKKVFSNALKKSQKIITPSKYVKQQLIQEWKINDKKILITPEAVDDKILTIEKKLSQKNITKVLDKFGIRRPFTARQEPSGFIFYVGNAHPHKNVEGLIKVFLEIKKKNNSLQLVLSGNDHYFWQRIKKEYTNEDIIYTGYVTDEELVALYKSAKVFVMPSLEEGFGIPLLEAFACSCPVVSSNAGSLSEVGGDGAIYFDPNDKGEMINKIMEVVSNEKLRKELINKGKSRFKRFSWEKLARKTLDIYMNNS